MTEMIRASCSQLLLKDKCIFRLIYTPVTFEYTGFSSVINLLHWVVAGEGNEATKS